MWHAELSAFDDEDYLCKNKARQLTVRMANS
jgi:hypothetical protein